jgi:Flp pilus assembly protein TadG
MVICGSTRTRRPLRWLPRMRAQERGSSVVEAVLVLPVAMMVILFAVQAALYAHAAAVVQSAAGAGDQVARAFGSSLASGEAEALGYLHQVGSAVVADPQVSASMGPAGMVTIEVRGVAESVLPGVRLGVSAVRTGPLQEFRVSG